MTDQPLSKGPVSVDPRGEFPFDLPEYLFHVLYFALRHHDAVLETLLHPLGLTLSRHRALAVISAFQPCTMGELASYAVTDRTTMTRMVDALVEQQLVERTRRPENRQEIVVSVTPAGREKLDQAYAVIFPQNRRDLDGISEADQRTLIRMAQALAANVAPDPETRERVLTHRRASKV